MDAWLPSPDAVALLLKLTAWCALPFAATLETAIELGFDSDLDHDSDLDSLRHDPRFRDLRQKMRLERRS